MEKRPIVHIEIPANDQQVGASFYAEVFGWNVQHMPDYQYTSFESGSVSGGIPTIDGEMYNPGDVIVYLGSKDLEADLENIETHGGKKLSDIIEIPNMGWMVHFADPSGNHLALWKSAPMPE